MRIAETSLTSESVALVAEPWLTEAAGFGVWSAERCEFYWPEGAPARLPDVQVPLHGFSPTLMLGVVGVEGDGVVSRLEADAALLSRLAHGEAELDLLAGELVDRHDQILALSELSRAIRQPLDLEASAQTFAAETMRLLKATNAFVVIRLGATEPPARGLVPSGSLDHARLDACFDRAVAADREMVVQDGEAQLLLVPVKARQVTVAVLGARRQEPPFQAPDLKLTLALGEQVSALVENALVHRDRVNEAALHAEMRLAARVQSDLLRRSWPPVRGLDIAATTYPASMVGGDFFDVFPLAPHSVFLTVGDVSGKGVPAALVMAMTRASLRASAMTDARDLHRLLSSAAGTLYDDLTALEMFVTAFLAIYDAPSRLMRFVNAGHSPVVHRPAAGPCTLLMPDEPPMGMLVEAGTPEHTFRFEAGDLLVVATDGINESSGPDGDLFGYDRLLETIESAHHGSAQEIGAAVFAAAAQFRHDQPAGDDQTILVVKGTAVGD